MHHAKNQGIDQTAVPVVEFRQGLRIAALHARDKFRIVFCGVYGQQYRKQHHTSRGGMEAASKLYIRETPAIKIYRAQHFLRRFSTMRAGVCNLKEDDS